MKEGPHSISLEDKAQEMEWLAIQISSECQNTKFDEEHPEFPIIVIKLLRMQLVTLVLRSYVYEYTTSL